MTQLLNQIILLLTESSVRILVPCFFAVAVLRITRNGDANLRHRIWSTVLVSMMVLPLLRTMLPTYSVPVAGWNREPSTPHASATPNTWRAPNLSDPVEVGTSAYAEDATWTLEGQTPRPENLELNSLRLSPTETPSEAEVSMYEAANETGTSELDRGRASTVLRTLIPVLWAIGAGFFLVRLMLGLLGIRRLVRSAEPFVGPAGMSVRYDWLGRSIVIKSTEAVAVPVTVGWLRPVILLPQHARNWSAEKLNAVLIHEQTHVVRHDFAVAVLAELNRCIYWFHPLAWWLKRQLSDLAEESCDDAAIEQTDNAPSYARVLLEVAAAMQHRSCRVIAPGLSMARSFNVEKRIAAILDAERPLSRRLSIGGIAALLIVGAFILSVASMIRPTQAVYVPPGSHSLGGIIWEFSEAMTPTAPISTLSDSPPKPIPNAVVTLTKLTFSKLYAGRGSAEVLQTFRTDAQGRYSGFIPAEHLDFFNRKDPNEPLLALTVTAPGYATESRSGLPEHWHQSMNFTLSPGTSIEGKLVDLEGRPVSGARITVRKQERIPTEKLGAWLAKASRQPELESEMQRVGMFGGPPSPESLFPSGNGLTVPTGLIQPAVTGPEGVFKLDGIGENDLLLLDIEGDGIVKTTIHVLGRDTEKIYGRHSSNISQSGVYYGRKFTFVAEPSVPVFGVVRDIDTKAPLVGVTVAVNSVFGSRMSHDGYSITTTDQQGRYRIEGLPLVPKGVRRYEGNRFRISPIGKPYFENHNVMVPARENSRSPIEFNIELKRAVMARGRIVNIATGEAVQAGIYYSPFLTNELLRPYVQFQDGTRRLMGNDTPYHTDSDGWFEIPVAPGRGVIAIQCDNRAFRTSYGARDIQEYQNGSNINELTPGHIVPSLFHSLKAIDVPADASEFSVELAVDPGQSVALNFTDDKGAPLSGVMINGLTSESRMEQAEGTTATASGLGIGDLRPLMIRHEERQLFRMQRLEPTEGQTELTVQLLPPAIVTGRLIRSSGKPLAGLQMQVTHNIDPNMTNSLYPGQQTGTDGSFEWKLPVGTAYTISAVGEKAITVARNLDVQEPMRIDLGDLIVEESTENWVDVKPKREPIKAPLTN